MFKFSFFDSASSPVEEVQPILTDLDSNTMLKLVKNNILDEPIACIGSNISDYCSALERLNNIDDEYRLEMLDYTYIPLYDFIFGNGVIDENSNEIIRFKVLVENFIKIHGGHQLFDYYMPILMSTVNSILDYQRGKSMKNE